MKKFLSLFSLLMLFFVSAWADKVVLSSPSESVVTHADPSGIITITDASGKTGIQPGSGSFSYDGGSATPIKLSGSRQFNLTYSDDVTVTKVTIYATMNSSEEGTLGTSSSDRTSLGNLPAKGQTPVAIDITGITGLNASAQFLGLIVVEYSSSAPSLSVDPSELFFSLNPSRPSMTKSFTLTGKNLPDGTYNITMPEVDGLSVNPGSFTVINGAVTQTFEVTYASNADVENNNATITAIVGEETAVIHVSYSSRITAYTQSTVSADAAWDWSKLSETVELTDETTPSKNEEFLLADLDDRITFTEAFGDPKAIKMEGMQFPTRSGYAQGTTIKFKTSVPGIVGVVFSNTGGNRPYRILRVNGKDTEFKSNSTTKVEATGIAVPAGEVVLSGWMDDGENSAPNMLRYYSITFTAQEPVTATFDFANNNLGLTAGQGGASDDVATQNAGNLAGKTLEMEGVKMTFVNPATMPVRYFYSDSKSYHLQLSVKGSKLRITAPEGKAVTKVTVVQNNPESTSNFVKWEVDKGEGTWDLDTKTWTGNTTSVRFNATGATYINSITVYLEDKNNETITPAPDEYKAEVSTLAEFNNLEDGTLAKLTLTDAIITSGMVNQWGYYVQDATAGAHFYCTGLDFEVNDVLNGFVYVTKSNQNMGCRIAMAEDTNADNLTISANGTVTPEEGNVSTINVPANLLKVVKLSGVAVKGTGKATATITDDEGGSIDINNASTNAAPYVIKDDLTNLNIDDAIVIGILYGTTSSNKIYPLSIEEDPTTGIQAISSNAANVSIFNLQGQRMEQVQKGLYIVNGKKVVIK